ncbi:MAG: alpha/beta hydrolase [Acidobacteriaceae bacterium]
MERMMKTLQWLATAMLVVAGIVLLMKPLSAHAQGGTAAMGGTTHPGGTAAMGSTAGFVPTRFTVVDEGTVGKPDVVMIPGLSSSRDVWDAEAKLLAPNYRLHLVQVDGFAGAPAGVNATGLILPGMVEELHAYIEAAGMKPVVVGHSLGGLLALMLAEKYPADVRKMVIVDTLPFYSTLFNPNATVEATKPYAVQIRSRMESIPADQYAAMQPMIADNLVTDPEGRKLVAAASGASDRAVVVEAMVEDMLTDLRGDVGTIKTPTLVLYESYEGMKQPDAATYAGLMKSEYKPMPHVTLVQVDGSRHFIMYDQPAKFDAALEGFLK